MRYQEGAKIAYNEHMLRWEDSPKLAVDLSKAKAERLPAKSLAERYLKDQVHARHTDLQKQLQAAKAYSPLAVKPTSAAQVLAAQKLYYQFNPKEVMELWSRFWNLRTASNVYRWAFDMVLIAANVEDPEIGQFLESTFVTMAHSEC